MKALWKCVASILLQTTLQQALTNKPLVYTAVIMLYLCLMKHEVEVDYLNI